MLELKTYFDGTEDEFVSVSYSGTCIGRVMADGNVFHCEPRGPFNFKATGTFEEGVKYLLECWRKLS